MNEPNPACATSLLDHLAARLRWPTNGRAGPPGEARASVWWVLIAAAVAAACIAGGAVWQAAAANSERRALLVRDETIARDRERAAAIAHALALPTLDTVLGSLRMHLPAGLRLVEAARDEAGLLTLAIDTPDPDALRATFAADARLRRFREQSQAANGDGTIRVRLVGGLE